jgi:hypothetical protein
LPTIDVLAFARPAISPNGGLFITFNTPAIPNEAVCAPQQWRQRGALLQRGAEIVLRVCVIQGFDEREQFGNKSQHAPRSILHDFDKAAAICFCRDACGEDCGSACGQAEIESETGSGNQDRSCGENSPGGETPFGREADGFAAVIHAGGKIRADSPAQSEVRGDDGTNRRQSESAQPREQRRQLRTVNHEFRGVRRIREAGARSSDGPADPGVSTTAIASFDTKTVTTMPARYKSGQPPGRTLRRDDCVRSENVEYYFAAAEFSEQHHAREEEINVCSFSHGKNGLGEREQSGYDEENGADAGPGGFGPWSARRIRG